MDTPPRAAGSFTTGLAVVAYLLGCTVMALVLMFAYGVSSAPRGSYGDALAIAVLAGVLHFAVLKLSRCRENVVIWVTLGMAPLAVIGGHVVGYGEAQDFAWRYVHDIAPQNFPEPEWRNLSHRENFRRFVGYATGSPGDGIWAYLRLQSTIGTSESRVGRGASGRTEWTLSGLFVWIAWLVHMVMLLLGLAAAAGAVAPDTPQSPGSPKSQGPDETTGSA